MTECETEPKREKEEAISNLTVIHHLPFFARLDDSLFSYFKRHFVIPPSLPPGSLFLPWDKLSLALLSSLPFFVCFDGSHPSLTKGAKKMVKRMKTNIDTVR